MLISQDAGPLVTDPIRVSTASALPAMCRPRRISLRCHTLSNIHLFSVATGSYACITLPGMFTTARHNDDG